MKGIALRKEFLAQAELTKRKIPFSVSGIFHAEAKLRRKNDWNIFRCFRAAKLYDSLRAAFGGCSLVWRLRVLMRGFYLPLFSALATNFSMSIKNRSWVPLPMGPISS